MKKPLLYNWLLSGGGFTPTQYTLSKLSVKYNETDFAYPASFGWSDIGAPRSGSRMIEGCTIVPDLYLAATNFNTGLAYDIATDRFISKNYGPLANEFFTRAAIKAACASAVGTLPTIDLSVIGTTNQGIAHDPINSIIFEYIGVAGATSFREYNYSGTLLANIPTDLDLQFIPGSCWYDYRSGEMYVTTGGVTSNPMTVLKKNAGGTLWETVDTKWYITKEGVGGIPNQDLIVNITSSASGAGSLIRIQGEEGFPVRQIPTPSGPAIANDEEGMVIDPRDLTIWYNEDAGGHDAIVGGNRLLHIDNPNGYYLKYHRFPNMFAWSDCKLGGNTVDGDFYVDEVLTGSNFTILPVVDYGANTAQQILSNWEVGEDEAAELEFRGSASAPTTSPLSAKDYHTLAEYDPNGSNDGWGATVPSAWQATPTTHRYMQARVKPIEPTPLWTPADLGSDLLLWSEHNSLDGLYMDPTDANRCGTAINYVDPDNNFYNPTAGQKPTWNAAGTFLEMNATSKHYLLPTNAIDYLKTETEVEVHGVALKNAASSTAYFLGVSELSNANNVIALQHSGSGASPANFVGIMAINGAGASSLYGFTDTNTTTWKMYSFRLGGSANKIYMNNVEQALTVSAGSNSGQCFDDLGAGTNQMCIARLRYSSSLAGLQKQRGIIITKHLSDANRALLMDYMQRIDMID